jgi:flagellar biosynthesis GTPase FlhF
MSLINRTRALPRTVVGTGLGLARMPLTLAARAAGQKSNDKWAPTLAFEGFEAGVEGVVGSFLRDDVLVERGAVRRAKVAQLRRASELQTIAEQQREQADDEFQARREQADQQRAEAVQRADVQENVLQQQAAERERRVEQKAAEKAAANQRVVAAQRKTLAKQERAAKAESLTEEAQALAAEREALDAAETVDVIDDSIEGTKAARRSS